VKNNELHVEWYLRSLLLFSWLKGRNVRVLLLDEGSTDDTLTIANRMAGDRPDEMQVMRLENPDLLDDIIACYEQEEVVLVRLSNEPDLQKIPLAH
jgi:glycosyltransferase involved in cell wall biosynthesis